MIRALFYLVAVLVATALAVSAHPVAQGAMEILVAPENIKVVARVSSEEAFVARALGDTTEAKTLHDVWQRHGAYLLNHLHLTADGLPLKGHLDKVTPPDVTARNDHIGYDFTFELGPGQRATALDHGETRCPE